MQSIGIATLFIAALAVIMLGLGLSLTLADFKRVVVYPRAVIVGLLCQMLVLPVICYALAVGFNLSPALAVGLMLLAALPGSALANLFTHLAKGDVALNITLTAVNNLLSLLTLPLIVNLALTRFMGDGEDLPIQFGKIFEAFALIVIPVTIGMLIRWKRPRWADRLDRPVRIISAVALLLIIIAAVVLLFIVALLIKARATVVDSFMSVGPAVLCFNLASMSLGYFLPRLLRLNKRQSIAIGMEICIRNGTLTIAITSILDNRAMAIPSTIYILIMVVTAAAFAYLVSRTRDDDGPIAAAMPASRPSCAASSSETGPSCS